MVLPFLDHSTPWLPRYSCPLYLAKDHRFAIQTFSLDSADEELGTDCVGSSLCHGQDARTHVLRDETLLIISLPTDGFAISAIIVCEVATLAHKAHNHSQSVKAGTFLVKSFFSSAQSMKVFCCLCDFVYKQLEKDVV